MPLVDPILQHSSLHEYHPVSLWQKFSRFNQLSVWFNIFIPVMTVILLGLILKWRYDRKRKLYEEYVPAPLNHLL